MSRRPVVNYALVLANVVLFVLGFNGASQAALQRIYPWLLHPDAPQLYQFYSSMFLHGGWGHLLGNMVFLWVFGNALNDRLGHVGYLGFYLAGGVLSGLGYVVLSGYNPVLGASGAISAVTGAYLVLFPRVRVTLLIWLFYLLTPMQVSSLYFLLIQFVWNLWMSLSPAIGGPSAGGVAYVAHSAGYVFGIALAALLLAVRVLPREPFDLLNLVQNWQRRSRYRHMVSQGYNPFGPVSPSLRTGRWVRTKTVESAASETSSARELQLRREVSEDIVRNDLPTAAGKYMELVQIADDAVLSRQAQLDIANYFMSAERFPAAADAYERFLRHYSNYEYIADIYLMLGVVYGRYLQQYDRAEQYLRRAIETLRDPKKIELARGDLQAAIQRRHG